MKIITRNQKKKLQDIFSNIISAKSFSGLKVRNVDLAS